MTIKLTGFIKKQWTDKKTGEQRTGYEIHGVETNKPDGFIGEKSIPPFFCYEKNIKKALTLGSIYTIDYYMWSQNGQTMCKPQGLI